MKVLSDFSARKSETYVGPTPSLAARAVVLDLGGVLIHVRFRRSLAIWADAAGVPVEALAGRFAPDDGYERHERGEWGFAEYAGHLRRLIGADLDDETLLDGWNAALGDAMDGAAELVAAAARRGPVYLFSNSNAAHHACWSAAHAALLAPMHEVFVSHLVGARKPDSRAFAEVARRIGIAPRHIAFFDDLAENVAGAREAGMLAWRVDGPARVAGILGLEPAPAPPAD